LPNNFLENIFDWEWQYIILSIILNRVIIFCQDLGWNGKANYQQIASGHPVF
jgi:hypothetical protein